MHPCFVLCLTTKTRTQYISIPRPCVVLTHCSSKCVSVHVYFTLNKTKHLSSLRSLLESVRHETTSTLLSFKSAVLLINDLLKP